jgi:hypothetical protein
MLCCGFKSFDEFNITKKEEYLVTECAQLEQEASSSTSSVINFLINFNLVEAFAAYNLSNFY